MRKHLVPTTALVAFAAAKKAALLKEATYRQISLELPDIRRYPDFYQERVLQTAETDED